MPKKKYEITDSLIRRLVQIGSRVGTVRELADEIDLPYHLVYKLVREHDVQLLDVKKEIRDQVLDERAKNPDITIADMARMLGYDYHTLHTILRRDPLSEGKSLTRGQRSTKWVEQIKQLAKEGLTQTEIARKLGITKQYVHLLRTQNHIDVQITNDRSETFKKSKEVVRLLKNGFTPYRIHIHTGYSKNLVYKAVAHYESTGKYYPE